MGDGEVVSFKIGKDGDVVLIVEGKVEVVGDILLVESIAPFLL